MKKFIVLLFSAFVLLALSISVSAHPGRTDSNGGHYNRDTGEYHYHNGSSAGRNTGGSSDSYSYSYFAGPTTDHNYDSDSSNQITETTDVYEKATSSAHPPIVIEIPKHTVFVLLLLVVGLTVFFVFKKIFIKQKSKKFAEELKYKLNNIENKEQEINRQIISTLKQNISELKIKEHKINEDYESIKVTNPKKYYEYVLGKDTIENIVDFPSGVESYAGFLFDTKSDEPYGRFTIYTSPESKTVHTRKGCDGAYVSHHTLFSGFTDNPFCSKCATSKDKYYKDKIQFINSIGMPYKKYKYYQNIISMYDLKLTNTEKLDAYSINGIRFERLAGFPDGIFTDGFIVNDKKSDEKYGRLTVYLAPNSNTIHLIKGCCKAYIPANMSRLSESSKNHNLCELCGYSEKRFIYFNAEKWYKNFLKIKNSYKELLDNEQNESEFF